MLNELGKEIIKINTAIGWDVLVPEDWNTQAIEALTEWEIENPHFVNTEDCMGNRQKFWRVFAHGPNDKCIAGCGDTREAAMESAKQNILNDPVACYKIPATLALITSEVSEALEGFRIDDKENFEEECADIIIRVLGMTSGLGIDIDVAVRDKLEKNKTREYRHGGKRL